MKKTIAIKVVRQVLLALKDLVPLQSLHLKTFDEDAYQKLRAEILTTGFAFTPHVTKDPRDDQWKVVDGVHRVLTLTRMVEKEGYEVGKIPCAEVAWDDVKTAYRRVLQGSSQYAKVRNEGLFELQQQSGLSFEDMATLDVANFDMTEYFDLYQNQGAEPPPPVAAMEPGAPIAGEPGASPHAPQAGGTGYPSQPLVNPVAPGAPQVRMLQLYMNELTAPPLVEKIKFFQEQYGTANFTDTVIRVVEEHHAARIGYEKNQLNGAR